ncbi:MAG: lysophospholipid acyltransferase family protein [Dehalococcoidia bacterium]
MLRFRVLLLISRVALHLPRQVTYAVAWLVGTIAYLVNEPARTVCADNVQHALGPVASPRRVSAAVRGCFRAAAYYYADLARTPLMKPCHFLEHNVRDHGFEHIVQAYASGKGVIIATIHYGNPEYVAQSMSARGYHFLALTETLEPPPLNELFHSLRGSQGQTFVDVGWQGMKAALRHLKSGGAVCIVCDRDIQHAGELVRFFGETARIPTGAIDLARHTGAALIPAVTRRVGIDRFQLFVEPPLQLVRTGRPEQDRRANTERLIQRFEPYLRRDPSQWFVLEQRIWGDAGVTPPPPAPPPAAARRGES